MALVREFKGHTSIVSGVALLAPSPLADQALRQILAQRGNPATSSFMQAVCIADLANEESKQKATRVTTQVHSDDVSEIERRVTERRAADIAEIKLPLTPEIRSELERNWMLQHYFSIVEEVVDARQQGRAEVRTFRFVPAIPITELPDGVLKEQAASMVMQVRAEDVGEIEKIVAREIE